MKHWISCIAFSALLFTLFSCEDNDPIFPGLSPCLEQKVQEYKDQSACGVDSARVTRFDSQIGFVYLFSYDYCCCDYQSPVLDADCNEVCAFGGIAGVTKCMYNGQELMLKDPVVVWQK